MRLLVLGGTKFLGRQVVQTALECGHEVAMFRVGHYVFMSSIAVYAHFDQPGLTEDAPLREWRSGTPEVWRMDAYGALKVGCENAVAAAFPGRHSCLRSGFIMGPYGFDLGHLGVELAAGRDISCSLPPERPIQILDSRDLVEFALRLIESGVDGAVNAVGLELSIEEVADAWAGCVPGARVNWVGDGDDLGLSPDEPADTFRLANARAVEAGLRLRSAEQTARDYIAWIRAGGTPPPPPH